jgi:hypothetical protein
MTAQQPEDRRPADRSILRAALPEYALFVVFVFARRGEHALREQRPNGEMAPIRRT